MKFLSTAASLIEKAIVLAQTYYPAAAAIAPFVQGIAAGILHTEPTPTNEDGSAMTPEQLDAYRAGVMSCVDTLLQKIDGLLDMAAAERARALVDLDADAPPQV